jgi:hypothetical protein
MYVKYKDKKGYKRYIFVPESLWDKTLLEDLVVFLQSKDGDQKLKLFLEKELR